MKDYTNFDDPVEIKRKIKYLIQRYGCKVIYLDEVTGGINDFSPDNVKLTYLKSKERFVIAGE